MVEPSESRLLWFYPALSLGGTSRKVIRIDLRLYDSLTKFHPEEKYIYHFFFIIAEPVLLEKCEKYFCYLYRIVKWYHIVACFSVCDNFPEFKNSETQMIYLGTCLDVSRYHKHHTPCRINRKVAILQNIIL